MSHIIVIAARTGGEDIREIDGWQDKGNLLAEGIGTEFVANDESEPEGVVLFVGEVDKM